MNFASILEALGETLLMTVISTGIAYLLGLPLGVLLHITSKKGLHPNKAVNLIVGTIVNILRSIPCLLFIIILIPVTNFIFGKGSWSSHWYSMIVPLTVASFPFISRIVEQSLAEVDAGVVEAAKSLGASSWQIITKVYIPEARASLISGFAVAIVSIIGYTSFAGYIASGGLISKAFSLGYYGSEEAGMWICILIVVIIVQIFQEGGLWLSKKLDKRKIAK